MLEKLEDRNCFKSKEKEFEDKSTNNRTEKLKKNGTVSANVKIEDPKKQMNSTNDASKQLAEEDSNKTSGS
jgi:hypothetical protein